ncbi:MAG: GNAT family N-acetyltransferase [Planctomycetes bacterium]|nr:GNAT family N-acetyltransferase [Planctomycetota bacterium]
MIQLREATDIDFYLKVRNDPKVWPGFYTQREPLTLETHLAWWYSRNQDWRKFIIELDGPIGILNIGQLDHWSPEIGYALLPEYWGKGYGTEAVKMALNWLKSRGYGYTHTTVLKTNKRSLNLLKGLGFEILGDAREGEVWLTKRIL